MFSTLEECNLIAVDVDQSIKFSKFCLDDAHNVMKPTRERSFNGGIYMNWYQQLSSCEKLKMHRI